MKKILFLLLLPIIGFSQTDATFKNLDIRAMTILRGQVKMTNLTPGSLINVIGCDPATGNTFSTPLSIVKDSLHLDTSQFYKPYPHIISAKNPTTNFNVGQNNIIDPSVSYSIIIGQNCIIDTNAFRDQYVSHAQAFGSGTEAHDWYAHAEGAGSIADGKISHVEGNNSMASTNDGHAEGNQTIAGRRRFEVTTHGITTFGGVNKAYVIIPVGYGNMEAYFPNALTDSVIPKYGTGAQIDARGNIYASGFTPATYNPDGTVNVSHDLMWALQPYMVIKGTDEWDLGFFQILQAIWTNGVGTEVIYNSTAEPYSDIQSVYSSYSPVVSILGTMGGNGQHSEGIGTSTWGYGSHAEGYRSNAWGYGSHAQNTYTIAYGDHSSAGGYHTQAGSYASTVIGMYNIGGGNKIAWSGTDNVFEVGIGSAGTPKNAMAIRQDGVVNITEYLTIPRIDFPAGATGILWDGNSFIIRPGTGNTFIGERAGNVSTTGSVNTAIGKYALREITNGTNNTAIGAEALFLLTQGIGNTAAGQGAGLSNQTGNNNTYFGYLSGLNATGYGNCFAGEESGYTVTSGNENTIFGYRAGEACTTASGQIWIGAHAGTNAAFATLNGEGGIDNSTTATPLISWNCTSDEVRINGAFTLNQTFYVPNITSATKTSMLYVDPGTKEVSVGAVPGIGYALQAAAEFQSIPDGSTIYWGSHSELTTYGSTRGLRRVYIPKTGTIKRVYLNFSNFPVGTTETSTIYIEYDGSAQTTISTMVTFDATSTSFNNEALNISVTQGHYIELLLVAPTFVTNPTVSMSAVIYIE